MARTSGWWGCNGIFHFVAVDEERIFNIAVAIWGSFALGGVADGRHGCGFCVVIVVVMRLTTIVVNYREVSWCIQV